MVPLPNTSEDKSCSTQIAKVKIGGGRFTRPRLTAEQCPELGASGGSLEVDQIKEEETNLSHQVQGVSVVGVDRDVGQNGYDLYIHSPRVPHVYIQQNKKKTRNATFGRTLHTRAQTCAMLMFRSSASSPSVLFLFWFFVWLMQCKTQQRGTGPSRRARCWLPCHVVSGMKGGQPSSDKTTLLWYVLNACSCT